MADNYLEKKMEDMRRTHPRPMRHVVRPVKAVFIADADTPEGRQTVIENGRRPDVKVAFAASDVKAGRSLAQQTGSRFYRIDRGDVAALERAISDARRHFSPLPLTIYSL